MIKKNNQLIMINRYKFIFIIINLLLKISQIKKDYNFCIFKIVFLLHNFHIIFC